MKKNMIKMVAMITALIAVAVPSFGAGEFIYGPDQYIDIGLMPNGFSPNLGHNNEGQAIDGMAVSAGYTDENNRVIGLYAGHGEWSRKEIADWSGVGVTDPDNLNVHIFHKSNVQFYDGTKFDLTDNADLEKFYTFVSANKLTVFQSPLVISDGELDVRPIEGAEKAIRRFFVMTKIAEFGIYQTTEPMTLYEASKEVSEITKGYMEQELKIDMAMNLPMGISDFCMKWERGLQIEVCGRNDASYPNWIPIWIVMQSYPM